MHDLLSKFFDAVGKGQTGNVRKFLRQGVNVNARDKFDGMTPLLKAAHRRNYVMQKILLSHGAKASMKDPEGLTALHFEAESGDVESVMLLLAHQAPLDRQNSIGFTALHYAANRHQTRVVDLLIFCGADAFIENHNKQSAISVCNDGKMKELLQTSSVILNGVKNNDIFLQNVELYGNDTYELEKLELTVYTPKEFSNNSLSFLCRRVRPEYSQHILTTTRKELLISDTFEYRISSTHVKAKVRLRIPLYSFPDPFEEIFMKTNTGLYQRFSEVRRITNPQKPGELKWFCFADVDLAAMNAFCLVTSPKVERFSCDNHRDTQYTSTVDPFVQLTVPKGTFKTPKCSVSLEIVPSPVYEEKDFDIITSVSHFYDLNQNMNEQPRNNLKMKLPLPQDYDGEGDLYVLGAQIHSDYYYETGYGDEDWVDTSLNSWGVIAVNPTHKKGIITFEVSHFSYYCVSEANLGESETNVIAKTSDLCGRASLRKMRVCFMVLLRPLGNNIFEVIVECVMSRKAVDRMNYWLSQRFLDQKPSLTNDFEAVPKTKYLIKVSRSAEKFEGLPEVQLEFHPKRPNFQRFKIKLRDPDDYNKFGMVNIYDGGRGMEDIELTRIEIRLTGTPFTEDLPKDFDDDDQGFTRDRFLKYIAKELKEEWVKVCVLAGLSYRTVEEYRKNPKLTDIEKKLKILQTWRDMSKLRTDLGVPDLVTALSKAGRNDLVTYINEQLHSWLKEKKDHADRFYNWLEEAFRGPNKDALTQENTPVPMSDQYFMLLAEKFGVELKGAGDLLNISQPEMKDIYENALTTNDEYKLVKSLGEQFDLCSAEIEEILSYPLGTNARIMRMLVIAREKCSTKEESFRLLMHVVKEMDLTEAKEWIVDSAKTWLSENKAQSPFSQAVQSCIEEASKNSISTSGDEDIYKRESFSAMDYNDRKRYSDSEESQNGANYIPPRSASRMQSSRQQNYDHYDNTSSSSENEISRKVDRRITESPSKQITFKDQHDSDSSSEYGIHHKSKTPTFQRDDLHDRRGSDASFRSGVAYTPLPEETSLIFNDDEEGMTYQQDSDSHISDKEEYIRPPDYIPDNDSSVSGRDDIYTPLPGDPVGMAFVRDDNENIFDHGSDTASHRSEYTPVDKTPSLHKDDRFKRSETPGSLNNKRINEDLEPQSSTRSSPSQSQTSEQFDQYTKHHEIPTFSSYSSQDIHHDLEASTGFQIQSSSKDETFSDSGKDHHDIQLFSENDKEFDIQMSTTTREDGLSDTEVTPRKQILEEDDHISNADSNTIIKDEEKRSSADSYEYETNYQNKDISVKAESDNQSKISVGSGEKDHTSIAYEYDTNDRDRDRSVKAESDNQRKNSVGSDEEDHTFITHLPSYSKRPPSAEEQSDDKSKKSNFGSQSSIIQQDNTLLMKSQRTPSPHVTLSKDPENVSLGSQSFREKDRDSMQSLSRTTTPLQPLNYDDAPTKFGSKSSLLQEEKGSKSSLRQTPTPEETLNKNLQQRKFGSHSSLSGKTAPSLENKSVEGSLNKETLSSIQGGSNIEITDSVNITDKAEAGKAEADVKGSKVSLEQRPTANRTPENLHMEEDKDGSGSPNSGEGELDSYHEDHINNHSSPQQQDARFHDDYDSYSSYSDEDYYDYYHPKEEQNKKLTE